MLFLSSSTKIAHFYNRNLVSLVTYWKDTITNMALLFNFHHFSWQRRLNPKIIRKFCNVQTQPIHAEEKSQTQEINKSTELEKYDGNTKSGLLPTFNFAAYIKKSENLQRLIELGVDLSKIEKRKGLPQVVLKLDFENDVKPRLLFLNDNGVQMDEVGNIITKNPLLLKEDLDDMQTRINYLESNNFQKQQITRIITKNPFWLMFSINRIENRLKYFQNEFSLSADDLQLLTTKQPRLITYHMRSISKSSFSIKEEMGFTYAEMKTLILQKPKLWMFNSDKLVERFNYIHNIMKISHESLLDFPEVLTSREFRIRQRHKFLRFLGKAQYDPKKDMYISLKNLVQGSDLDFVVNIAKSDIITYNNFLRTL